MNESTDWELIFAGVDVAVFAAAAGAEAGGAAAAGKLGGPPALAAVLAGADGAASEPAAGAAAAAAEDAVAAGGEAGAAAAGFRESMKLSRDCPAGGAGGGVYCGALSGLEGAFDGGVVVFAAGAAKND